MNVSLAPEKLKELQLAELKAKIRVGIEELNKGEGIDGGVSICRA